MMQLSLIEPASRANDPVTSHVAASMASGMAERHREIIFEALMGLREATIFGRQAAAGLEVEAWLK